MEFGKAMVIGTGMMGPGIACTLALGGVAATIVSRTAEGALAGLQTAKDCLNQLVSNGLIPVGRAAEAGQLLDATSHLDEAAAGADLVVESVPEDMGMKKALFARLDSLAKPETTLASNTSGLSITEIAAACTRPERVITTHFWNPPHLMPLVEIVRGERTGSAVVEVMADLWRHCGKVPVIIKKDRPGQLGNRLQMALVREAVHIVAEGIADVEDVDTAAKLGFGMRLPVYGVLEHMDMVGLDLANAVCDYVARDLNNEPGAPALFRQKIERGETGVKAGRGFHDWSKKSAAEVRARRDRFLIECLRGGIVSTTTCR